MFLPAPFPGRDFDAGTERCLTRRSSGRAGVGEIDAPKKACPISPEAGERAALRVRSVRGCATFAEKPPSGRGERGKKEKGKPAGEGPDG